MGWEDNISVGDRVTPRNRKAFSMLKFGKIYTVKEVKEAPCFNQVKLDCDIAKDWYCLTNFKKEQQNDNK